VGNAAGDLRGGRWGRRAGIRITRNHTEIDALLSRALVRSRRLTLGTVLIIIGDAAGDLIGRRARTRARHARAGPHVHPALRRALLWCGFLALERGLTLPLVLALITLVETALDVARVHVLGILGHLGFEHIVAVAIAHLKQLTLGIAPQELRRPDRGRRE